MSPLWRASVPRTRRQQSTGGPGRSTAGAAKGSASMFAPTPQEASLPPATPSGSERPEHPRCADARHHLTSSGTVQSVEDFHSFSHEPTQVQGGVTGATALDAAGNPAAACSAKRTEDHDRVRFLNLSTASS